jgi:L-aminopeptidase/D-esterase-like protein
MTYRERAEMAEDALRRIRDLDVDDRRYGYQKWFEQVRQITDSTIAALITDATLTNARVPR